MPIDYAIDQEANLVDIKCEGELTLNDLIEAAHKLHTDDGFRKGMNSITDLTDSDLQGSFDDAMKFQEFMQEIQDVRGRCKWALITPTDSLYGLGMMMATVASALIFDMKPFKTRDEAMTWINS